MASAEEAGTIILELSDSSESKLQEVLRFHTVGTSQATITPTGATATALPTMPSTVFKGKRVICSFISDAADTIESEESNWKIPLHVVDINTGQVEQTRVTTSTDWTGFKNSGTTDIVCAAATKQRVAYIDAPEGKVFTLAGGLRYHAYIGDDTA
tara:strand:- start:327 stop:791 length:465 start_codon:yes stop_codon:yes gene_type:complete